MVLFEEELVSAAQRCPVRDGCGCHYFRETPREDSHPCWLCPVSSSSSWGALLTKASIGAAPHYLFLT